MTENKEYGSPKKINEIHSQIQAAKNPQERKTLSGKLLVEVWNELNASWSKKYQLEDYSLEITETVKKCLEKFDEKKGGDFSHYLLAALRQELKNAVKEEEMKSKRESSFESMDDENDESNLMDILSAKNNRIPNGELHAINLDSLERDFKICDETIRAEYDNKKIAPKTIKLESSLLTLNLLEQLDKDKFYGLENEVMGFCEKYSFVDKKVWMNFFKDKELLKQNFVASKQGFKKDRASKIMSEFYKRLKKGME